MTKNRKQVEHSIVIDGHTNISRGKMVTDYNKTIEQRINEMWNDEVTVAVDPIDENYNLENIAKSLAFLTGLLFSRDIITEANMKIIAEHTNMGFRVKNKETNTITEHLENYRTGN